MCVRYLWKVLGEGVRGDLPRYRRIQVEFTRHILPSFSHPTTRQTRVTDRRTSTYSVSSGMKPLESTQGESCQENRVPDYRWTSPMSPPLQTWPQEVTFILLDVIRSMSKDVFPQAMSSNTGIEVPINTMKNSPGLVFRPDIYPFIGNGLNSRSQ